MPNIEHMRRAGPQAAILREQIRITIETLQILQEELRPCQGEAVWRKWCSEWHAADPHLTTLRQDQLTRHVVNNLWGATDYSVSPRLRRNMMTAAKQAIRAHWPAATPDKIRPDPLLIHLLHSLGLGGLDCGLLLLELLPGLARPKRAIRLRDQKANGKEQSRAGVSPAAIRRKIAADPRAVSH